MKKINLSIIEIKNIFIKFIGRSRGEYFVEDLFILKINSNVHKKLKLQSKILFEKSQHNSLDFWRQKSFL